MTEEDDPLVLKVAELTVRVDRLEQSMSKMESDMSKLKDDVSWLKKLYFGMNRKLWGILSGVILAILIQILFKVI